MDSSNEVQPKYVAPVFPYHTEWDVYYQDIFFGPIYRLGIVQEGKV